MGIIEHNTRQQTNYLNFKAAYVHDNLCWAFITNRTVWN